MELSLNWEVIKTRIFEEIVREAERINARAAELFEVARADWTQNAEQRRALGALLLPKPEAPLRIHITAGPDGWPVETFGPDRVAAPIADLPPILKPSDGIVVLIGQQLSGNWYQCLAGDNAPPDSVTTRDGAQYRKVCSPWGSWYQKL